MDHLDDTAIKILESLRVPSVNMDAAASELLGALKNFMEDIDYLLVRARNLAPVARLSKNLLIKLSQLSGGERDFLSSEEFPIDLTMKAIAELEAFASFLKPSRKPNHRPRGSFKAPDVQLLIISLQRVARKYGGRLTLGKSSRTGEPNGSLPRVLIILREVAPTKVPAHLSYQTLVRMRRYAASQPLEPPRPPNPYEVGSQGNSKK